MKTLCFTLLALSCAFQNLEAQWISVTLPDTPRMPDGKPNLNAPVPKAADGKPDLSGIWKMQNSADRLPNGEGRGGMRYAFPKLQIPLQPWAKAVWDQRFNIAQGAGRPSERCLPHTVPDALMFGMFKIVYTPRLTVILQEEFNYYRQIHTDGRTHPRDPEPAWYGYSVGSWDGDALIVNTHGFKIGSWLDYGWFDDSGIPYTSDMKVTERFRRTTFGHMQVDVTVDDPKAFTRPWSYTLDFALQPDTELVEDICENEQDVRHNGAKKAAL